MLTEPRGGTCQLDPSRTACGSCEAPAQHAACRRLTPQACDHTCAQRHMDGCVVGSWGVRGRTLSRSLPTSRLGRVPDRLL